ncbi:MAG: hypothetical protein GY711_18350 [bacterium]|nr:hypothetical protein [bacterium]
MHSLTRAVALEPSALNLLFLGDAAYAADDFEEARAAWSRAQAAEPAAADDGRARLQRELARRRVERMQVAER